MQSLNHKFAGLLTGLALGLFCVAALAQSPTYHLGRTATQEEIKSWDVAVGPDGKGLPPGSGTAKNGAPIYARKCARCHGKTGTETMLEVPPRRFVGGEGTLKSLNPVKTIGSFWPFAVSIWDQINRAMPPGEEGSLSVNEVYAVTALLLYWNGIITDNDVVDAKSLPKIQMPNRNGFVPMWPPQYKIGEKRLYGQYP